MVKDMGHITYIWKNILTHLLLLLPYEKIDVYICYCAPYIFPLKNTILVKIVKVRSLFYIIKITFLKYNLSQCDRIYMVV